LTESETLEGLIGFAANRKVLLGFAPASLLHRLSFADTLDEDTGRGYQRRFNAQHSLDFRKYIQQETSSTIPLTFNLRPPAGDAWELNEFPPMARLIVTSRAGRVLSQVDCQHRLGYLNDLQVPLPFMIYIGLSIAEETEIFNVINSKAKGLSTSLLDFHDATLSKDLGTERPELFIALHLNNNIESPWYRQLDLGGASTSGLRRRASLRTLQKAIKKFVNRTKILRVHSAEEAARIVLDFWSAVAIVLRQAWDNPSRNLINKGIGVYALMGMAGDLYLESIGQPCDKRYFVNKLCEFVTEVDWTTSGPFKGLGGEAGVNSALAEIRSLRTKQRLRIVQNG
jgi:DNA sulfur modification protein DndB